METFLGVGLGNAVVAAALALVAEGVGRWCRRPAVVHCLWLLVLLKLLSPPLWRVDAGWVLPARPSPVAGAAGVLSPEIAGAAEVLGEHDDSQSPAALADHISAGVSELTVRGHPPAVFHEGDAGDALAADALVDAPKVAAMAPGHWLALATAFAWASGSVVCAVVIAVRVVRFGRLLRYAELAPAVVQRLASVAGGRMGLSQPPQVRFVPGSVCPMLWAVGRRPRVLVPRALWARLGVRQRSSMLAHELAHVRRRDHWLRIVELLVVVAYWWCPVAWWARRRLREAEEQCCDAWVVWALPAGSARAYAGAILEAVEFVAVGPRLPVLASGMGQFALLKRRFAMIRSESVPRTLSWCGRVVMAAAAVALLPLAPSRAQSTAEAGTAVSAGPEASVQAVEPALAAPVPVSSAAVAVPSAISVPAAFPRTAEAAVIGQLAVRAPDADDRDDDDDTADAKAKNKAERDRIKDQARAYKDEVKAKLDRDRREAHPDVKGPDLDDEVAQAREEVRTLGKQLEKAAQRLAKLEATRHGWHGDGRPLGLVTPPRAAVPPVPPLPVKPLAPGYGRPGDFTRGKGPDNEAMERSREQRLQQIENRLQALMKEIEAMRHERDANKRSTRPDPATK